MKPTQHFTKIENKNKFGFQYFSVKPLYGFNNKLYLFEKLNFVFSI